MTERRNGFSLIEVLVAILILTIVSLAVAQVAATSLATAADNATRENAATVARETLESLRSLPLMQVAGGTATVQRGGQTFRVQTAVVVDSPGPNMRDVAITVRWNDRGGAHTYDLRTVLS